MLLSPQAERNWQDLCSVLEDVLEDQSHRQLFALELGSGTGQHVIRFAQKMPFVTWQPSDIKEESRDSIKAYIAATHAKTILQPIHLDASETWEKWAGLPRNSCDVIIAINLLQYSSFKTAQGVFNGAGQMLRQNGLLITYGVYAINGTITPSCNEQLDAELRNLNPEWGLPDMDVLRQLAYGNGMRMERIVEMEEYYKCLIFRKL
ncbi:methyltransferase-like 26 B [Seriola lalandi dorsalis]|uniref:Zgc:103625 n=1 Tax=Seriola lalandi dorsalis TaxID=1841481 RepID=A0A3B4WKG7_SERLL|nr:methyltransferase-like 26 B [Seriola lalandi dorsalis]XP_023260139.1 methyltransferase-like 26 B [Seriola lalandi dorsalis]XP_056256829.1 methyltransferase-like 26 B [Seriola aureovittata]XP_056256830.1 methyltransferase-like 26 B [Seriola aureovittata]